MLSGLKRNVNSDTILTISFTVDLNSVFISMILVIQLLDCVMSLLNLSFTDVVCFGFPDICFVDKYSAVFFLFHTLCLE